MIPEDKWGESVQPKFIHCWHSGGPKDGEVRGVRPRADGTVIRASDGRVGRYDRVGDILLWMGWFKT